jgi:branched-chain amino acid transport system substrate-binding protein
MEGIQFKSFNGEVTMRASDHQMQQPLFMSVWKKATAKGPGDYSTENTGYNFAPVRVFEPYVSSTPTSCQMQRPKG